MWFGEGTAGRGAKGSEGLQCLLVGRGEGFRHSTCPPALQGPSFLDGGKRGKTGQAGESRKIGASQG